jgi:hypothetical protein
MDAMKSTHDEIALQGIEFWSNVCDEEYELQLLQQEVKILFDKFRFSLSINSRLKNKIVNQNEQVVIMHVVLYHI